MSAADLISSAKKPLITVITPVYKRRGTLLCAVDSVLEQTYPNIEYVIIDDGPGSVDEELIRERVQTKNNGNIKGILFLKNNENLGTAKSLNIAIKRSGGKYIFNLADDDCFYDSDVLSDWVDEFERTGARIITAKRAVYDKTLTNLISVEPNDEQAEIIKTSTPAQLLSAIAGANMIFGCSTAKTKELLSETGGYDENYRVIEDYSSNVQLLRKGFAIHFFDRIVVRYRYGGISAGTEITKNYLKESDELFEKEVLPYVPNKKKARAKYLNWRCDVVFTSKRKEFAQKWHESAGLTKKFLVISGYFFKHPGFTIKLIGKKIMRK